MSVIRRFIAAAIVFAFAFSGASSESLAAIKTWEHLKTTREDAKPIIEEPPIEIKTLPSKILITVSHTSHIEIFTILGRLVSSETVHPGSYEMELSAHGVYIIKVGDLTCKVAI